MSISNSAEIFSFPPLPFLTFLIDGQIYATIKHFVISTVILDWNESWGKNNFSSGEIYMLMLKGVGIKYSALILY